MEGLVSNERELVLLLMHDDENAFKALYHLYSGRLLGYLKKLSGTEDFALEILQETFVRVWNNRSRIEPEKPFRSYLFSIAANLVYDLYRKAARDKKLRAALQNSYVSYICDHPEESVYSEENTKLLREAIQALPPKRREIFQLIKIEERSYDEVSKLLKVSTSTINDHIVKATKSIRERLLRSSTLEINIVAFSSLECLSAFF